MIDAHRDLYSGQMGCPWWIGALALLFGCDNGGLNCKDAVNRARASMDISLDEAAGLIGRCEQHNWTLQQRSCIGSAHALDELPKCVAPTELDGLHAVRVAEVLARMTNLKDEMCACTDAACAQRVSSELTKWSQEQTNSPPKMSDEETRRATAIGEEMGKCMQRTSGAAEAMAKMREFRVEMCACSDTACAQRVSDEMATWSQEQAKDSKEPPKMTDEETKEATQIGEAMGKCMQKAMGAGTQR
jgi:hypothetical protein